ncbi:MAG: hypothetical protein FRX48_06893 [Lasallia pustulata]|uniref:G-protein coupled receptors family 2 profile 2 domain-containing protein n=1 Tax=Lasallia pustulata TaxID=136370 RepID=A0A5M8PJZ6_9LECA|nr:MAG: hypothetical protein FRX48_06893 [Lasallia pustulata]
MSLSLSPRQSNALEITQRITSSFSILGSLFVIATYLVSSDFHKPINRLVFYASWGNLVANVATLVAQSGIRAGCDSVLCQAQGFAIQMFVPADALWTLAMACSVYLKFFHHYSTSQLRGLELKYLALCYGVPFVPAVIYLFVQHGAKGRIYGPANLWCWVAIEYDFLRAATFYGPVWLVLILTMFIYILVGRYIYSKRRTLREFPTFRYSQPDEASVAGSRTTDIPVRPSTGLETPKSAHYPEGTRSMRFSHPFGRCQDFLQSTFNIDSPKQSRGSHLSSRYKPDAVALACTKVAFLFFAALLITWVPATVNRAYIFLNGGLASFPLLYMVGLLLPLQGFWNAVIYISTSMSACREMWSTLRGQQREAVPVVAAYEGRSRNNVAMSECASLTG